MEELQEPIALAAPITRIPETEEAMRAAVMAAGGKPMICQDVGKKNKREITENKKRLLVLAKPKGEAVEFVAA